MAKYKPSVASVADDARASQPARANPDEATIAALAYQLWLARGCPIGSDQDDWYRAESLLQHQSEEELPGSE